MRSILYFLALGFACLGVRADNTVPPDLSTNNPTGGNGFNNSNATNGGNGGPNGGGNAHVVLKFNGADARAASAMFNVQDKWQIYWFAPTPVNLTILTPDGSTVAGLRVFGRGSVYEGKGGNYYLQVESATPSTMQWFFVVAEVAGGTQLAQNDGGMQMSGPPQASYTPPVQILPPSGNNSSFAQNNSPNANNGNGQQNSFGQPFNPQQNSNGQQQNAPAPTVKLTDDQERAVVLIKGDNAEGTGFLTKTPEGPVVVTNIHVIANNPNLKITTNTGALVTVVSYKAAADRDLAMVAIKDAGYSYLETSTDISKNVQPGDEVVTPGNSQGGEVMLNTGGHVLGIGPERIEFDNPIYHGNSGGPVFHTKSGKVLGVVTEAMKVDTTDALDKASFASRNSAISNSMRYFGLRLDTVTSWMAIDARSFQVETAFLDQFHEQSRRLDSLLNRSDDDSQQNGGNQASNDDVKLYLQDDKIMKALHNFWDHSANADQSQMADARRGLLFDLQAVADQNLQQIQNPNNFYSFDQTRAKDELSYRKALKSELDNYGDNIARMPRNY